MSSDELEGSGGRGLLPFQIVGNRSLMMERWKILGVGTVNVFADPKLKPDVPMQLLDDGTYVRLTERAGDDDPVHAVAMHPNSMKRLRKISFPEGEAS